MRILFVAMPDSIHTARWLNQVAEEEWDIHLFPSTDATISADLRNLTVHDGMIRYSGVDKSVRQLNAWPWPFPRLERWAGLTLKRLRRSPPLAPYTKDRSRAKRLAQVIRQLKPDIVHSMEMQHAGYLTLDAKRALGNEFPVWFVSIWGSDIYYFSRFQEHTERIKAVLANCSYYNCECHRDVVLARSFGFKGHAFPALPVAGFDLARVAQFQQAGAVSSRRLILLKGYQTWAGRALVGLRAIDLCADHLKSYRVTIYLASPEVKKAAKLVSQTTSIPIEVMPFCSHDDMLRLHGQARIHIGLSITDGISVSCLEAMVMGAFPIQSCTACADEWIVNGKTGLIVPPEDPEAVAAAIRSALSDDDLVDNAAVINAQMAKERLADSLIKQQVISMYKEIWSAVKHKEDVKNVNK
jgi:glycosyltransferase involved in cell wall biosynthesis